MARKYFQQGSLFKRGKSRPVWVGRWWEEIMAADGRLVRVRRSEVLGSVHDMPKRRDALRALSDRLHAVNGRNYPVKRTMRFTDFVQQDWSPVALPALMYATQKSYDYLLRAHLLPLLRISSCARFRERKSSCS